MSIKTIARDLYRYQQEVERLEAQLKGAAVAEKLEMEVHLQQAKKDRDRWRGLLEGNKESGIGRRPR